MLRVAPGLQPRGRGQKTRHGAGLWPPPPSSAKPYIKVRNNYFALDGLLGHTACTASAAGHRGPHRADRRGPWAPSAAGSAMNQLLAYDSYPQPCAGGCEFCSVLRGWRGNWLCARPGPRLPCTARWTPGKDPPHDRRRAIKMMRDSAICSQLPAGEDCIDTHALIDALRSRKFAGMEEHRCIRRNPRTTKFLRVTRRPCCRRNAWWCRYCSSFRMWSSPATRLFLPVTCAAKHCIYKCDSDGKMYTDAFAYAAKSW